MDLGWINWDFGFGFGNWHGRMGLDFGLKVFKYGWDGVGDSYSWMTNMQWLLLIIRIK